MFHAGRVTTPDIPWYHPPSTGNPHTSRREQARTDSPVCQCTEIEHGSSIQARIGIISNSPKIEDWGPMVGFTPHSRQLLADQGQFLTDNLTGQIDIGIPFNSTHTTKKPLVEDERTRRTWVAPFTAVLQERLPIVPPLRRPYHHLLHGQSSITVGAFKSGNTYRLRVWNLGTRW